MELLDYTPTQADPDVWIKRATKNDGTPYYKMMLIYVDDVLHLAEDPKEDMIKLSKLYRLKDGTGEPDRYLGGNIERVQTNDGSIAWSLSCHDFLLNAIRQEQLELSQKGLKLKEFGTGLCPYPASYRPEMDVNKRHNAICYHRVREAQAAGVIRVGWIEGKFNSNEAKRTFVQHIFNNQVTPLPAA